MHCLGWCHIMTPDEADKAVCCCYLFGGCWLLVMFCSEASVESVFFGDARVPETC